MNTHTIDDLRLCSQHCGYWKGKDHVCHPHPNMASVDGQKLLLRNELRGKGTPYFTTDYTFQKHMRPCEGCGQLFVLERSNYCRKYCKTACYYEKKRAAQAENLDKNLEARAAQNLDG